MRLDRAIASYLVQLEADGQAATTIAQAGAHLGLLATALGPRRVVTSITPGELAAFLVSPAATRRPDGSAKRPSSMNILRSRLRSFGRFLLLSGAVRDDPARLVRRARCGPPPPKGLSPADEARVRAAVKAGKGPVAARDRALVALLLGAGLRLGAALALNVQDLDFEEGEARIAYDKGRRPSVVVLPIAVVKVLRAFLRGRDAGPIFPGAGGGPMTSRQARRRIEELGERAGLPARLSPHALRHTYAMGLYARTGDLALVQAALQHHSIASTLTYARCSQDRLRRAVRGAR